MSRKLEHLVSTVLLVVAVATLITCIHTIACNRALMRHRRADARLQWLAKVEDEEGVELGMMYRWKNLDACVLAGYHSIKKMPCPPPPQEVL